ncbi:unnamed protein product [Euphydryas editha]|uniref:Uncharacterized protein n=1 Tax=Euphydryas editha TaxID=104508 RepID=A0AAU9TRP3_EUPED|nr:unnamed protein product [Euphydryas editha]
MNSSTTGLPTVPTESNSATIKRVTGLIKFGVQSAELDISALTVDVGKNWMFRTFKLEVRQAVVNGGATRGPAPFRASSQFHHFLSALS